MDVCDCCGNEPEPALRIVHHGHSYVFDCFECAIELLAPHCRHCGTKVIGHGVRERGEFFCCAHCAEAEGRVLRSAG